MLCDRSNCSHFLILPFESESESILVLSNSMSMFTYLLATFIISGAISRRIACFRFLIQSFIAYQVID